MKSQKTIYHLIVDRSGSMGNCTENTITGFNEQIMHIRRLEEQYPEQELTIGLTLFNNHIKHLLFQSAPLAAPLLTTESYQPGGSTSLLDAIGSTTLNLEKAQKEANHLIPTTVVIVIITDGHENSSREFSLVDIRALISKLEATGNWTFSFLGATLDAVDVAESMNINRNNSAQFQRRTMKEGVWNKLSDSMSSYSEKKRTGKKTDSFFEE